MLRRKYVLKGKERFLKQNTEMQFIRKLLVHLLHGNLNFLLNKKLSKQKQTQVMEWERMLATNITE